MIDEGTKTWITHPNGDMTFTVNMLAEDVRNGIRSVRDQLAEKVAQKFWAENKTMILAQLDPRGLASLIALIAAKEIARGEMAK
jgi:hypothetical protein